MKALVCVILVVIGLALIVFLTKSTSWAAASIALLFFGVLCSAYLRFRTRWATRRYRRREDQRERWLASAGTAGMEAVDRYLEVFCESFSFPKELRYKLSPDDNLNDYYQSYYFRGEGDELEHVHFLLGIEDAFGIQLSDDIELHLHTMTLGQLLTLILNKRSG